MMTYKIQSLSDLEAEVRAVARGERPVPADAAKPSCASAAALMRLLTPENLKVRTAGETGLASLWRRPETRVSRRTPTR